MPCRDDLDAALIRLRDLGGKVYGEPIDIGIARIAVVADSLGAAFALYDGQMEP